MHKICNLDELLTSNFSDTTVKTWKKFKKQHIFIDVTQKLFKKSNEPGHEKACLIPYANNKGADQPAHPRSLISTFAVHCLDSIVPILSKSKISGL